MIATQEVDTENPENTASIIDCAWQSSNDLEKQVSKLFPEHPEPEAELTQMMVSVIATKMLCQGWSKGELIEFMVDEINEAKEGLDEIDQEEGWLCPDCREEEQSEIEDEQNAEYQQELQKEV